MTKKMGFIDLFIDEWHANNYPKWLREAPRAAEFELGLAWEDANRGGRTLPVWCKDFNMTPAKSLEEVVEKSDCLFVLAPSNPEVHERLADVPLRAGKPLYIDKPFAPSKAAAERIFALAEKYHTPLMSSSALRYGDELLTGEAKAMNPTIVSTTGGGRLFDEYAIHQIEMIVSVMGTDVKDIKLVGDPKKLTVAIEFGDGRLASMCYAPAFPFTLAAGCADQSKVYSSMTNTFQNLLASIMDFFATGVSPIPKEQTIAIASILERSCALLHK